MQSRSPSKTLLSKLTFVKLYSQLSNSVKVMSQHKPYLQIQGWTMDIFYFFPKFNLFIRNCIF